MEKGTKSGRENELNSFSTKAQGIFLLILVLCFMDSIFSSKLPWSLFGSTFNTSHIVCVIFSSMSPEPIPKMSLRPASRSAGLHSTSSEEALNFRPKLKRTTVFTPSPKLSSVSETTKRSILEKSESTFNDKSALMWFSTCYFEGSKFLNSTLFQMHLKRLFIASKSQHFAQGLLVQM